MMAQARLICFSILNHKMFKQNFVCTIITETDQHHQPLPPPKAAAQKMKTDILKTIQEWQDKFGEAYKKLALGYNFLKTCKQVSTVESSLHEFTWTKNCLCCACVKQVKFYIL